jgi:mannan endo-1,4-beta-mannosidase
MKISAILLFILLFGSGIKAGDPEFRRPVSRDSSPEATELLNFLYDLSGKKTLSGQHDQPLFGSAYYMRVYETTRHYPAIKGMDFGFSERNTLDGINFRQQIVDDAIEYAREGAIITLMWHAVPPTKDEPVTFSESIQGDLTDEEWQALITPDTYLNKKWQSQVDVIAFFLKQIQDAGIPVIWRPYHEMNGDWFWWGKKTGENGYKKLYIMLFDRLVNYHKINNLLWVFNPNEISGDWMAPYADFYPGDAYVDILATDVYRGNYQVSDYEQLLELGGGKPVALGEVGKLPTPEILSEQAKWVWFMVWVDHFFLSNEIDEAKRLYNATNILNREEMIKLRQKKN